MACGVARQLPQGMASMEWRTLSMKSTRLAQSSRRWNVVDTVLESSIVSNLDDSKVSNFLWPFKLSSPKGGFINKRCRLGKKLCCHLLDRCISCVVPCISCYQVMAFAKPVVATGAIVRTPCVLTTGCPMQPSET